MICKAISAKTVPLSLVLAILVSGCGPIYSTEYRFTPPKARTGERCISSCQYESDDCKRYQNDQKDSCEYENQRLMDECSDRIWRDKQRKPKWTECGRQLTCDFSEEYCDQRYRLCYEDCGGVVTEEQVCILNCEQAAPPKP